MPRLFTGLEIPTDVAQQLLLYRGGLPGARWVEAGDLHITLRFLGDVDNRTAQEAHEALDELQVRPFEVSVDGLASFGGDRPRAVYASVVSNPVLMDLQSDHERIARRVGLAPETRKFTPHVTLARLGRGSSAGSVAHYLSQMGIFPLVRFTASRFALFSARESRGGGPYRVEAVYPDCDDERGALDVARYR